MYFCYYFCAFDTHTYKNDGMKEEFLLLNEYNGGIYSRLSAANVQCFFFVWFAVEVYLYKFGEMGAGRRHLKIL